MPENGVVKCPIFTLIEKTNYIVLNRSLGFCFETNKAFQFSHLTIAQFYCLTNWVQTSTSSVQMN